MGIWNWGVLQFLRVSAHRTCATDDSLSLPKIDGLRGPKRTYGTSVSGRQQLTCVPNWSFRPRTGSSCSPSTAGRLTCAPKVSTRPSLNHAGQSNFPPLVFKSGVLNHPSESTFPPPRFQEWCAGRVRSPGPPDQHTRSCRNTHARAADLGLWGEEHQSSCLIGSPTETESTSWPCLP